VADVECTCWEPDAPQPRWEHQEIIQVGARVLKPWTD